ncbi:MAG: FAD-dependent monooxygenase [Acidobacteriota bacterium]|nr:MAG: FAD-dependent monooxygenase [Acidobacteriota bacterium]
MAILLGRAGYEVELCERRADPREDRAPEGRSINLALSTRGLYALERAGVLEPVLALATPMRGRMIHDEQGALTFQPYGPLPEHAIHSVSRAELNRLLIAAADQLENVRIRFEHKCVEVDLERPAVTLEHGPSGEPLVAEADAVIGADGAFSALRSVMQRQERFSFEQAYLDHGYKELTIPPGPGGQHRMEPNALHIWPRGGFMMIALPNLDGSFTCTLFWPFEGPHGFAAVSDERKLRQLFESTFPDALALMPTLIEDYFQNRTGSLVTIRCRPWRCEGKALLLGDSAHAVVPFYGQGANAAFEDCALLADAIERHDGRLEQAFAEFETQRKRHVDALSELALANYVEMRDHTASRWFVFRKKLEQLAHFLLPSWYVPLYTMVTFTRIPYGEARRRAARQARVVRWALGSLGVGLAALILGALVWR